VKALARLTGRLFLLCCLVAATVAAPGLAMAQAAALAPAPVGAQPDSVVAPSQGAPLFIENVGQFDPQARFLVRGGGGALWLAQDALWLTLLEPASPPERSPGALDRAAFEAEPRQGVHLRLSFVGANPEAEIVPLARSETIVSYFIGNDPDAWRPDVPVWHGARYVDLYPGLDLEITGEAGQWAWRMVATDAAASLDAASLDSVQLRVEGADALALERGALRIETALGPLGLPLLGAVDAQDRAVATGAPRMQGERVFAPFGEVATNGGSVAAQAGELVYSTFLGGGVWDYAGRLAVDAQGRVYVSGITTSDDYPTTPGAFDAAYNGGWSDLFVSVLNPEGTELVYSTFLGGNAEDYAFDIAVDEKGQAHIVGVTRSTDFPITPDAFDSDHTGYAPFVIDLFVTALASDGASLVYSTFLGRRITDGGNSYIAVDAAGRAYVTGPPSSPQPITPGAYDTTYNGSWDLTISVLNPQGTDLVYSTYLGGNHMEMAGGIAVDHMGRAYVTGRTRSPDFPATPGAFDTGPDPGLGKAFVTVLNPEGSDLIYSTFLGGSGADYGRGVAVDRFGRAYVVGSTQSRNFPVTPGAYDTTRNGINWDDFDAFVSVLTPDGSALVYSTFLGGSASDGAGAIALDWAGRAYVTGSASSSDFPTTPDAYSTTPFGKRDVFVSILDPQGARLVYSTLIGGNEDEWGRKISLDAAGRIHIAGSTASTDYPTTPGAYDTSYNGGDEDVFVTVLEGLPPLDRLIHLPALMR
jgi:hypothetical protein